MTLEQARKILNRARDGQDIPRSQIDLALAVTEATLSDSPMDRRTEREKALDILMQQMPEAWRARWCIPGDMGCACLGCANNSGGVDRFGFTKEEHEKWVADNMRHNV